MSVLLRDAWPTDAGKVGAILSGFVAETPWMPNLHSRAEDIGFAGMMIDRGWVRVAWDRTHLLGFCAREGEDIHALYVAATHRRQGIGAALIADAQAAVPRLTLWTFQANAEAQAFYAALGFTEAERTDGAANDEKLPDIRLVWERA